LSTIDEATGDQVDLFNPRTMEWSEHFAIESAFIVGCTPTGRGTVRLLDMNNDARVAHRQTLIEQGEM
jgi:hypothetical protein